MDTDLLGKTCALLAAVTWAGGMVLFKRSGEHIQPLALNLFKSTVGLLLLCLTLLVQGDGLRALDGFPYGDVAILLFSGVVGIALADTLFFRSLNLIGVGLESIVDCLYSPFVILFSFLMLSEHLAASDYAGIGLIITAVFVSSRHTPPPGRTRGELVLGVVLGAMSVALMAFGIVLAKPVLDLNGFPLIWATALRLLAGTITLGLLTLGSPMRRAHWRVFRPSAVWKLSIPASILGNYLALIFWMAGFKYTKASIAGILNQTSLIFALIFAALFLRESFSRRKLVAVALAAGGVVLVAFEPF